MADIFISYAHPDRKVVHELHRALMSVGWSVWWDRYIQAGKRADEIVIKELEIAKSIIVIWSSSSIQSRWVLDEADLATELEKVVPVRVGNVLPPIGFRRLQYVDLSAWDGTISDKVFEDLVLQLEQLIGVRPVIHDDQDDAIEVFKKFMALSVNQILVVIKIKIHDGKLTGIQVEHLNDDAKQFWQLTEEDVDPSVACVERLKAWTSEEDFDIIMREQVTLFEEFSLQERMPRPKIPARINAQHPLEQFRGASIMPLVVAGGRKIRVGVETQQRLLISYVPLNDLCEPLPA